MLTILMRVEEEWGRHIEVEKEAVTVVAAVIEEIIPLLFIRKEQDVQDSCLSQRRSKIPR